MQWLTTKVKTHGHCQFDSNSPWNIRSTNLTQKNSMANDYSKTVWHFWHWREGVEPFWVILSRPAMLFFVNKAALSDPNWSNSSAILKHLSLYNRLFNHSVTETPRWDYISTCECKFSIINLSYILINFFHKHIYDKAEKWVQHHSVANVYLRLYLVPKFSSILLQVRNHVELNYKTPKILLSF